jgi:hypothetical protein
MNMTMTYPDTRKKNKRTYTIGTPPSVMNRNGPTRYYELIGLKKSAGQSRGRRINLE